MGHHFVVQEVIAGGQHHAAVQNHQVAEGLGLVDLQFLERCLLLVELLFHLKGERCPLILEYLGKPAVIECCHVLPPDVGHGLC